MAGKARKQAKTPPERDRESDVDSFAADALDFCGDGCYDQFLDFMAERDYTEADVERLTGRLNARAGRSS